MDAMGALGLGIVLTLKDQVSAGLDKIRQKMAGFTGATQDMIKNFDKGAKMLLGGMTSIVMGVKALSTVKNVFSSSINTAANFEQAMARVGAVSGTTGEIFNALANQAKELGATTQFSASQVASAQESLARAGFKALGVNKENNEIIAAMPGLLSMAAAEGMELGSAADIASSAIRGFGMEATEAERVADVLAKTSAASNTSIALLGESLKYVAPYAKAVGVNIEQTNAMLGVMANAGIKGTQAGNALKAAFVRLSEEPKRTAKALAELGVKAKTSTGDLRPLPELMKELAEKMKNMGKADRLGILNKIFGSIAGGGMLAIMDAMANGSLPELEEALFNCSGAAKEMADRMNNTLKGAMLQLESATEGLSIAISDHLIPVYTKAVRKMAEFKSWLTKLIIAHPILSKTILGVIGALTLLISTALIAVGALATVGGAITLWKNVRPLITLALTTVKTQAIGAMGILKGMLVPVTALIILAGALYYAWQKNFLGIRDFVRAISEGFKMVVNAGEDGITEVSDMTYEALRRAGLWDFALTAGRFFWRIKQFALGFIEGLKDAWDTLKSVFEWVAGIFDPVIEHGGELLSFLGILKPLTETQSSTWRSWGQLLGQIVPIILSVVAAFKGVSIIVGIIKTITAAIALSGKVLSAHPVIAIITAVIFALILLYNHWDEVKEAFAKGVNFIRNVFRNIGKVIRETVTVAVNWVKSKWQAVKNWWNSWTLKDIFAPLINFATRVKDSITQKWESFKSWWSEHITLSNIFEAMLNFCDDIINGLKVKWEDFKNWLKNLFTFNLFSSIGSPEFKTNAKVAGSPEYHVDVMSSAYAPPSIPHAEGGIFSQPHLGLVAEAGREAIVPLEDKSKGIPLLIKAAKELGISINKPVKDTYIERISPQIINVYPEIHENVISQFNPDELMAPVVNVSVPVNDSQIIRENLIRENSEIVTNNIERFVPIQSTNEVIKENNNNLVDRVLPQIINVPYQDNVEVLAKSQILDTLNQNLLSIKPQIEVPEVVRDNITREIITNIVEKILTPNVVVNTPESIKEVTNTSTITNNNSVVEKALPPDVLVKAPEVVTNIIEKALPLIVTINAPQSVNSPQIIRENLIRENNEVFTDTVEKFIPVYTEQKIVKENNNNNLIERVLPQIINVPPEVRETVINSATPQLDMKNFEKIYGSSSQSDYNLSPIITVNIPEPVNASQIIRENLIRESSETVTNNVEKFVPIQTEKEILRENNNFTERYQLLTLPPVFEKFYDLTDKFFNSISEIRLPETISTDIFQDVINSLADFRLEQPQNNSPATRYLIQQDQNQAAMNGAATVQAVQQSTENIVRVDNQLDVKVSPEPITINLDGERLYSRMARFTERHTLREGGGSRL